MARPRSSNAATIQGPSPDGQTGYPVPVVGVPGETAVDVNVTATVPATGGTATNRSRTLATAGTAETVMASNTSRKFWQVCNPHATALVWVSITGTAAASSAGSIPIYPGECVWGNETNAITAVSNVNSTPITAEEY